MRLFLSILIFFVCVSGNCSSQESCPHHISIGFELLNLSVDEKFDTIHVDDSHYFLGLRLNYEYLKPCAIYFGADLLGVSSSQDFKVKENEYHGELDKSDKGFGNLEFRVGYTYFQMSPCLLTTPFLGIGVYETFPLDHHHDFGFESCYPYVVGGLRLNCCLGPAFTVGLKGKLLHTFSAEQKFKLSTETLKKKDNFLGGEIGLPLTFQLGCTKRWTIQFEPYYLSMSENIYGLKALFGCRF